MHLLAHCYMAKGDNQNARKWLEAAINIHKEPVIKLDYAKVLISLGKKNTSREILLELVDSKETKLDASILIAKLDWNKDRPKASIQYLHKIIQENPRYTKAYLTLGSMLEEIDQQNSASKVYQAGIRLKLNHKGLYSGLARTQLLLGNLNSALDAIDATLKFQNPGALAYHLKALILVAMEDTEEAKIYANYACKEDTNFAESHYLLGIIECLKRNPAAAKTHFKSAISIKPSYENYWATLAILYEEYFGVGASCDLLLENIRSISQMKPMITRLLINLLLENRTEDMLNISSKYLHTSSKSKTSNRSRIIFKKPFVDLKSDYCAKCDAALIKLENFYNVTVQAKPEKLDLKNTSSVIRGLDYQRPHASIEGYPEVDNKGLQFLLRPKYWMTKQDCLLVYLLNEIAIIRSNRNEAKISLFEIGPGTGYLIHILKSVKEVSAQGCDVYNQSMLVSASSKGLIDNSLDRLEQQCYALMNTLLGQINRIANIPITNNYLPDSILVHDILYAIHPVFDQDGIGWEKDQWIEMIKHIFQSEHSKVKTILFMMNAHSIEIKTIHKDLSSFCYPMTIHEGLNHLLVCRKA
ncbi:tetratricopeptide repeat protein [Prochlorococcus marinus]|uniref:tetratricopeptide repeat protein n=1 Tax=Prochlorococcus marinus TaxID=1219 RepID=UPI0018C86491|nr:hypothetical protein [Prochlorococcus marinus]